LCFSGASRAAWERRYGALSPARTPTNRRLYSAEDVEKLLLMRRAAEAGHSVGQIAGLTIEELRRLLAGAGAADRGKTGAIQERPGAPEAAASFLADSLRAIENLDAACLEDALARAAALLGSAALIDRVLQPLLQNVGNRWREGALRCAHEHLATAAVRTLLGRMLDSFQPDEQAPRLIATTPAGQIHELGALFAAVAAASEGWRPVYLGPNLPAAEIAGAAHQANAKAVALSLVYPPDDPRMPDEMAALRKGVGPAIAILAGGRAAAAYRQVLESVDAVVVADLAMLRRELEALRFRSSE
jgi:methanogenic corrinoid protein MtbC1